MLVLNTFDLNHMIPKSFGKSSTDLLTLSTNLMGFH